MKCGFIWVVSVVVVLVGDSAADPFTLPADGDAWSEYPSAGDAENDGWFIESLVSQTLIVSTDSKVGSHSVGCRAQQARWCDTFGLTRQEELAGVQSLVFWQQTSWDERDFWVRVYMDCTPDETAAGYDQKRVSWLMPTTAAWSTFAGNLTAGEWAWRLDGWNWCYSGGNTELTTLIRIEWFYCQYFDIGIGDQVLIDGLHFVGDAPTPVPTVAPAMSLAPAVPNPFNPATEIGFELPRRQSVVLEILSLDGRRIRTLLHEEREAGHHAVVWHGRDGVGRRLPSGSYRCVLTAGNERRSRSVTLLK